MGDGTHLKSLYDNKCADQDLNSNNVYMHPCHSNANQQWLMGENEKFHTNQDSKCLDINLNTDNVYMHPSHGGNNQKFYLENVVDGLEHDEVRDEVARRGKRAIARTGAPTVTSTRTSLGAAPTGRRANVH